jgi:hypothetical protein
MAPKKEANTPPALSKWNQCKIDAAVETFVETHGNKGVKTFRESLTKLVTANPNHRVTDMAQKAWEKAVPEPNYQRLENGGIADVHFSQLTEFTNKLPVAIESCKSSRGK